ncbi:hypothetical protein BC828DRAFT_376494 [Blastocladiella britannica]|nr:hypothetical protein BC828DRAFT_376494 [Blastocladiella britannica]
MLAQLVKTVARPSLLIRGAGHRLLTSAVGARGRTTAAAPPEQHGTWFDLIELRTTGQLADKATASKPPVAVHTLWLRDHCKCPQCWHPMARQRLVETHKIPKDIKPSKIENKAGNVIVTWSDGHISTYSEQWLVDHAYGESPRSRSHLEPKFPVKLWGAEIASNPPTVHYDAVMDPTSDAGLADWLRNIATYGFSFVNGVPPSIEKSRKLAERIAFIRETHYGTYWDFTPNLEHGDTAYTTIALPAHTDTTYFTDPVGLQLFHILQVAGKGGESLLVDGFKVAADLKSSDPDAYAVLRDTKVPAHCAGDATTYIYPQHRYQPMLTEDADGNLVLVRYNNNDRSTLNHLSRAQVERYYAALAKWQRGVESATNEFWYAMKPGTLCAIDNQRVMHGRASFEGTQRRLTGCYINGDDWQSRLRTVAGDGTRALL